MLPAMLAKLVGELHDPLPPVADVHCEGRVPVGLYMHVSVDVQ